MTVQLTTRVDKATKQKFDKVCELIGVSSSNALSILVKGVVNYNGIPFSVVAVPEKPQTPTRNKKAVRPPFNFGSMSGKIWKADDFDAPLDDFKEYME